MLCSLLSAFSLFRPPHLLFLFAALGFIPLGVIHDGGGLFGHIVPLHGVLPGILAQRRAQHTAAVVDHLRRCVGVAGALNLVAHDLERLVKLCRLLVKQAVHFTGAVVVGGVPALFDLDAQSLGVAHLLQSPGVLVPRDLFGLDLRLGAEINIIDYNGTLDLDQKYIDRLDFVIAGIHSVCYKFGSKEENTAAIINAIKNPNVNIISHPDDGRCPLDYEALVQAAKEYHVLLEINNNALRDKNRKNVKENQKLIIENCKKYNHPFIMGSDAHFTTDIANYDHCGPLVESMNVDNELIMNYYPDRLREFLRK